jgi:hypothetical protein
LPLFARIELTGARVVSCVIKRGLNAKLLTSEAGVNEVQDVRFRNHSEGDKTD